MTDILLTYGKMITFLRKRVMWSAPTKQGSHLGICGVAVVESSESTAYVATDGHRLTLVTDNGEDPLEVVARPAARYFIPQVCLEMAQYWKRLGHFEHIATKELLDDDRVRCAVAVVAPSYTVSLASPNAPGPGMDPFS